MAIVENTPNKRGGYGLTITVTGQYANGSAPPPFTFNTYYAGGSMGFTFQDVTPAYAGLTLVTMGIDAKNFRPYYYDLYGLYLDDVEHCSVISKEDQPSFGDIVVTGRSRVGIAA
jgi:hypothetical protein